MSAPSGGLSCAELQEVTATAESIWATGLDAVEYKARVDAALAVRQHQSARFEILQDPEKDREVKIWWSLDCSTTTDEDPLSGECEIGGDEIGANCETYGLDTRRKVGFTVNTTDLRTSGLTRQELIAKNLLRKIKLLDEFWAKKVVAVIDANVGRNLLSDMYTVSATTTTIPAYAWNADLEAYLALVAETNGLGNGYLISGRNLWLQNRNARRNAGNADGSGDAAAANSLPIFHDLFNVDQVVGQKATYLVLPGTVSMVTKNYYGSTPVTVYQPYQQRYSIGSNAYSGVSYDVFYTSRCANGIVYDDFTLRTKGGIFVNSTICNGYTNGLLKFICG